MSSKKTWAELVNGKKSSEKGTQAEPVNFGIEEADAFGNMLVERLSNALAGASAEVVKQVQGSLSQLQIDTEANSSPAGDPLAMKLLTVVQAQLEHYQEMELRHHETSERLNAAGFKNYVPRDVPFREEVEQQPIAQQTPHHQHQGQHHGKSKNKNKNKGQHPSAAAV